MTCSSRPKRFGRELHVTYDALDALYRSGVTDVVKQAEKKRLLEALSQRLGIQRVFNNASLAGSRTYASGQGGFAQLKAACGTWEKVLGAAATLKSSDFDRPQQENFDGVLQKLAARQCPTH